MKSYKIHGQVLEANNEFHAYARRFNVSLAAAIGDRDYPMSERQCIDAFIEGSGGHSPSYRDLQEMRPDSQDTIQRYLNELQ